MSKNTSHVYVCGLCGQTGHNRRTCGRSALPLPAAGAPAANTASSAPTTSPNATIGELFTAVTETEFSSHPTAENFNAASDTTPPTVEEIQTLWVLTTDGKTGKHVRHDVSRWWSAEDTDKLVETLAIADGMGATAKTMKKFLDTFSAEVRMRVARRSDIPVTTLVALSKDRCSAVRIKIMSRENLPEPIIRNLIVDKDPFVRTFLCYHNPESDKTEKHHISLTADILQAMWDNPCPPQTKRNSKKQDFDCKKFILQHEECPVAVLDNVAKTSLSPETYSTYETRAFARAALSNPNLPGPALDRYYREIETQAKKNLSSPNTVKLAQHQLQCLAEIAGNPNISEGTLQHVFAHPPYPAKPDGRNDTLFHYRAVIMKKALGNRRCTTTMIEQEYRSPTYDTDLFGPLGSMVQNPNTPKHIIEKVSMMPVPSVPSWLVADARHELACRKT